MSSEVWQVWAAARPAPSVLHLDTAAVGRSSRATLAAVAEHARLEAEVGGYVAEAMAQERLELLREDMGALLGTDADGVAFVESAAVAFTTLLAAWPLPDRARVAVAPAEWGPNVEVLRHRGCAVEVLETDAAGVIDLEALARLLLVDPPDLVLVDQVAAHRGLVQPAGRVVALARAQGVPVWVDAAQSLGQVHGVTAADAVFATSRKWLGGPRGVGVLAVAEQHRPRLRVRRPAKRPELAPVRCLESEEAHVAGRVGLGVAVREHLDAGPARVATRLAEVGALTREAVADLPNWEVVHPEAPAAATTALRPTAGQDLAPLRERLLDERGILASVCLPWRAPLELGAEPPLLRLSPQVDLTDADLDRVCRALREL